MSVLFGISLWPTNTQWPALRDAGLAADGAGSDRLYAWATSPPARRRPPWHRPPSPRAAGDPDTVARRLHEYWLAGARGFVLSGAYPFDLETIERVGHEVRARLEKLIAAA